MMNIRLSDFQKTILGLVTFTALMITTLVMLPHERNLAYFFAKIASIFIFLIWSISISFTLRDVVSFKYKISKRKYYYKAKYLTIFWLFIPYWKVLDKEYHDYETQNLFGAKYEECYTTDVTYSSESDATKAIDKHKETMKIARKHWFERPSKEDQNVKYL